MSERIYITGLGIISAIGNDVPETLESLRQQRHGIGKVRHLKTRNEVPVGEVSLSDAELISRCGLPASAKVTRTALLGLLAAREAAGNAGLHTDDGLRTGIISATSVGGMGVTENRWLDYLDPQKTGDWLKYIETHECGDSTEFIADQLGFKDYVSTISTACSSSANSIMYGARLIKHGVLDRAIVGGTDSLSRFTINGFNTLMILDAEHCKPFDAERKGLNLGEGAGFIVLESERAARNKNILALLSGYGNANDAYHQTASSPDGSGAYLAMQKAFAISGLKPSDIDYINAHGTGTAINDLSEGTALERMFDKKIPAISSTKPFTGHTLAACGGIEAVFSVLAIQHHLIFPSLNFKNPMPELNFTPTTALKSDQPVRHVLSNSFGFGGNTSALIFSQHS